MVHSPFLWCPGKYWPFYPQSFYIENLSPFVHLKAHLRRRFLSRQLDAIFVTAKLHQVSNMFRTPVISQRPIALKIAPGLHTRFWSCNLSVTKIASSCRNKTLLCKRALRIICYYFVSVINCYLWNSFAM